MKRLWLSLGLLFVGCGGEGKDESSSGTSARDDSPRSESDEAGFNLAQGLPCPSGRPGCVLSSPQSAAVQLNAPLAKTHPTIFAGDELWVIASDFGVPAGDPDLLGSKCAINAERVHVFEESYLGYRVKNVVPGYWYSRFRCTIDPLQSVYQRALPRFTTWGDGRAPQGGGIFSIVTQAPGALRGTTVTSSKTFIVADRGTKPVQNFKVVNTGIRSEEGLERLRVTWSKPTLPVPAGQGRLVGYYLMVDGSPLAPLWRIVDEQSRLVGDVKSSPSANGLIKSSYKFFREVGETNVTSIDIEVTPGSHRVTLAYAWEVIDRDVSKHVFNQAFHYSNALSNPMDATNRTPGRMSGIATSPGSSVDVIVEDDVTFDRDYYAQNLWWIPKGELYAHYMKHGITEGRIPSPLLLPHLLPDRLTNLPLKDALAARYQELSGTAGTSDFYSPNLVVVDVHQIKPGWEAATASCLAKAEIMLHQRCLLRKFMKTDLDFGSNLFQVSFYLDSNPDVARAAQASGKPRAFAISHFLTNGMAEKRLASSRFNESGYLARYPDVANAVRAGAFGGYGGRHYLKYGQFEGRSNGY